MKAIRVNEPGGPEKLVLENIPVPEPKAGQVLVKVAAAGVNFIDIYQRTGLYPVPSPFTPGQEGAGIVEGVGAGVDTIKPGDHVTWYYASPCSYAEYAVLPANVVLPVPTGADLKMAAASMLQGMTAHYLTHSTYTLKAGDICLVHAAAGGTGMLITQMAKMVGAQVIGTTSTAEKAAQAKRAGAVVYDSVGKSTWEKSLNCLRPRGMMVTFGNASGPVDPIQPLILSAKGSIYLTRPKLADYVAAPEELKWRAGNVLGWAASGRLKITIDREYTLGEAAQAHIDLASRRTSGKLLLTL
jgi:NADPH:quinone reductase